MSENVLTGQQIGLLGGPLYTTYKVLGAVYKAREIGGQAVYWLETNDADFNEINHIDYMDAEGELRRLTWDIPSQGYSCGYIEVDRELVKILSMFFATVRQTEHTPMLRDMALDCYTEGITLGEASMRLAKELYGGYDIRFFTPFEPDFREFTKRILFKEAVITPDGEQCNVFCVIDKQRKAIFRKGESFVLRDGTEVDPASVDLVPNVRTRNICQDAYFDAHTYVAGPGEVKYIAELDERYEFHGVRKADVMPRMSVSLIEPRHKRMMKRKSIPLEMLLQHPKEELLKKMLEKAGGIDINETRRSGMEMTSQYIEKLQGLGFEKSELKEIRKYLTDEVKKACGNLRAREKGKHNKLLEDAAFLSDNLFPLGKPQERVFNVLYYMNLYWGMDFIPWLFKHYDPETKILELIP